MSKGRVENLDFLRTARKIFRNEPFHDINLYIIIWAIKLRKLVDKLARIGETITFYWWKPKDKNSRR
jgi:hypothetical protein